LWNAAALLGRALPLGIVDHLRRAFACFKLCAQLLDLRRLLFLSCAVSASIRFSWSSTFVVSFEELVEYIAFTKSRYLRRDFICFRSMAASIAF
jgi:hypothetical protein